MEKIGFIGLGIMGKPMAMHLLKAGYELTVYDINPQAVAAFVKAGAGGAASPRELAQKSDIIFTIVPKAEHVWDVVAGETGILQGAAAGTIIIDMSSISPVDSRKIAEVAAKNNCIMFDAPVSGGEPGAINATLAFMVGGPAEYLNKIEKILLTMGKSVTLVGCHGSGSVAKLANQIMVNLNIAAMSEALVLAQKAGVDPAKVFQAVRDGLAGSAVLEAKAPMVVKRNFKAGGRLDINLKDITNVLDTAHTIGVPLPLTAQLLEIMHALKADGHLGDDHAGMIQFYEKLAGVEVKEGC
ncbi:2-hydroxy-3-oxopropionate reductase [Sporomusa acidovorans]|uniref:2-hydroxy-3-oxopropionate reductase n=1 Tax=Sporomusa acidovorans (strain ATCC 49682 / DSM 3132 / Mol) TaxID=1123286 RepID=A0ABZ3J6G5_SPOA4|nr:2-hydroxy-3-oxopropionate reductase [Sporomusa acidovorans]OZC24273.1 2-hydroxy-3-oxopropionate reductase [Sporomusa acidovorans DSM 3132]SDF03395.1 2-hydroxy-3-oxopropionate reductase [Sporomusa acidovorans]